MIKNHAYMFPDFFDFKDKIVQFVKGKDKFGIAQVRGTSEVGKYKGTKGHDDGDGFVIIFNEEINTHPRSAYLKIEENLTTNDQFMFLNAWNWDKANDLGAIVSEPDFERSGKKTFKDVHIDKDLAFDSIGEAITLRMDGLKSPNILAGKRLTRYTFFNQSDLNYLRKRYSEDSPQYKSQARAYPDSSSNYNTVLDKNVVYSTSRYKDVFVTQKEVANFGFMDAAFGGRDNAEFSWACVKDIYYTDGGNQRKIKRIIEWKDYIREMAIVDEAYWNDFWIERATKNGLSTTEIKPNEAVTPSEQLVVQCAEHCMINNIPFHNYGYDFSLNDELVTAHNKLMGFAPRAMNYNKNPLGFDLHHLKENTKDFCYNRRDEILFSASSAFHGQLVRGGKFIEAAIDDLCDTRYQIRGKKRKTESNAEFKDRNKGRSPDKLVAMTGTIEMARLRGVLTITPVRGKVATTSTTPKIKHNIPEPRTAMRF